MKVKNCNLIFNFRLYITTKNLTKILRKQKKHLLHIYGNSRFAATRFRIDQTEFVC